MRKNAKQTLDRALSIFLMASFALLGVNPSAGAMVSSPDEITQYPDVPTIAVQPEQKGSSGGSVKPPEIPSGAAVGQDNPLSKVEKVEPFQTVGALTPDKAQTISLKVDKNGNASIELKAEKIIKLQGKWDPQSQSISVSNVARAGGLQNWKISAVKGNGGFLLSRFEITSTSTTSQKLSTQETLYFRDGKIASSSKRSVWPSFQMFEMREYVYSGNQWFINSQAAYRSSDGKTTFQYGVIEKKGNFWVRTSDSATLQGDAADSAYQSVTERFSGQLDFKAFKNIIGNGIPQKNFLYFDVFPSANARPRYIVETLKAKVVSVLDSKKTSWVGIVDEVLPVGLENFSIEKSKMTWVRNPQEVKVGASVYQVSWGRRVSNSQNMLTNSGSAAFKEEPVYGLTFRTSKSGEVQFVEFPGSRRVTLDGKVYQITVSQDGRFNLTADLPAPVKAPEIVLIQKTPEVTKENKLSVDYIVDGVRKNQVFTLKEGENQVVIVEENQAGLKSSYELKVRLDTTAPVIVLQPEVPAETYRDSLKIEYSVDGLMKQMTASLKMGPNNIVIEESDEVGNKTLVQVSVARKEPPTPKIEVISQVPKLTNQTSLEIVYKTDGIEQRQSFQLKEGVNPLRVSAVNEYGKSAEVNWAVERDTIAPVIKMSTELPAETFAESLLIRYSVDGGIEKEKKYPLSLGANKIRIEESDAAGNQTVTESVVVRKEAPLPDIRVVSDIPSITSQSVLSVRYTVDGAAQDKEFSLKEGSNQLRVEGVNLYGKRSEKIINVTLDTVAPEIRLIQEVPLKTQSESVNVKYSVDGVEKQKYFSLRLGANALLINETDAAGNASSLKLNVTREDIKIPESPSPSPSPVPNPNVPPGSNIEPQPEPAPKPEPVTQTGLAPVFTAISDKVLTPSSTVKAALDLKLSASDPEGGAVSYAVKSVIKDGVSVSVPLGLIVDSVSGVVSYSPQPAESGMYVIAFAARDRDGNETLQTIKLDIKTPSICRKSYDSEACGFFETHKDAAGMIGIYYDNRDGQHSHPELSFFPQLSVGRGGPEAITIANASVAGTYAGGSMASQRLSSQGGADKLYQDYRKNTLEWNPAHLDFGKVDYFVANTTFAPTTLGSSQSELDDLANTFYTLAAFKPQVRALLMEKGLLMPTLQMIFRLARVNNETERYLSGEAHPVVVHKNGKLADMLRMAYEMTPETIPSLALLKVQSETFSSDRKQNYDGFSEKVFDTPAAISRVFRGPGYTQSMILDAGESLDPQGRGLEYRWVVTSGDPQKVRVTKLNDSGSQVRVEFDWQEEFDGPGASPGTTVRSNRAEVMLFTKSKDAPYWSPPAVANVYFPRIEKRVYDESGKLKEIQYPADIVQAPSVGARRSWLKDEFHANGSVTRTLKNGSKVDFTPEGYQVVSRDSSGRVLSAKGVTYQVTQFNPKELIFPADGSIYNFQYADAGDQKGRIGGIDITDKGALLYRGRLSYDAQGGLKEISVASNTGAALAVISNITKGEITLSLPDGSRSLRMPYSGTLANLIRFAGVNTAAMLSDKTTTGTNNGDGSIASAKGGNTGARYN